MIKKSLGIIVIFILFVCIFYSNISFSCISPFALGGNLYAINIPIETENLSQGDWYQLYDGKLYSNVDFRRDSELHKKVIDSQTNLDYSATIYPNIVSISIGDLFDNKGILLKNKYNCKEKDEIACNSFIADFLKKLKEAGYINIKDGEIDSIVKVARNNQIISKVGFFQFGAIKIPPLKWISYSDEECFNMKDAYPLIVMFWQPLMSGSNILMNTLIRVILVAAIILIFTFIIGKIRNKKIKLKNLN